jgi:hypothetical protein
MEKAQENTRAERDKCRDDGPFLDFPARVSGLALDFGPDFFG